jgi:hypothetical protein
MCQDILCQEDHQQERPISGAEYQLKGKRFAFPPELFFKGKELLTKGMRGINAAYPCPCGVLPPPNSRPSTQYLTLGRHCTSLATSLVFTLRQFHYVAQASLGLLILLPLPPKKL